MIIDGRQIAESIYVELEKNRPATPVRLGIVIGTDDPVIESFVRIKSRAAQRLGVEVMRIDMPKLASTLAVADAVRRLEDHVDGVIVQLPLPKNIDSELVLSAIPKSRDVDGLNLSTADDDRIVYAPVAAAVEEILKRSDIDPKNKNVVVIGAGRLVGAPVATMLRRAGAQVNVVTLEEGSMSDLHTADIIISGAGHPGMIRPEMIKDGVVLIDAGTSESGGKVVGDADPSCADKASVFTPVPGGVGPIAVAMIFKNLFELMQFQNRNPRP